jgi:N utilization substance protein A
MKGMRVQSIIRELRGEKIDIIEYNDDPLAFAANSLSPAKINHVSILELDQKHLEVIVDDTQLSLAIGKKGQNVRLAAKLLGWHVDIKSEEEKRQEIESQMAAMALRGASISELHGLGDKTLQRLAEKGVETVEQLAQMTPDDLTQIPGIGEKTVEKIRRVVTDYFEQNEGSSEALAADAEAESVKVDEPLVEHPAPLETAAEEIPEEKSSAGSAAAEASVQTGDVEAAEEIPEEKSSTEGAAAEASAQTGDVEAAAEQAESSEGEGSAGEKGGNEE